MPPFPSDAPRARVIRTFERLGFRIIREREHIAMVGDNPDGSRTPLTVPNHRLVKGSTLRSICTQSGVSREEFLDAYDASKYLAYRPRNRGSITSCNSSPSRLIARISPASASAGKNIVHGANSI